MTIGPITQTVVTRAPPARAFDLFTSRMGDWWPRGKTIGQKPHAALVMEPGVGGRWYETDADGGETRWGEVLAWEPPHRVLLAWRISGHWTYDPDLLTEVEVTFAPADGGGTRVTLEHRRLEAFGPTAAAVAAALNGGWPTRLAEFAARADADAAL